MKGFLFLLLALMFQTTEPVFEISEEVNQIHSDNLGNLYVIKDFTLYKYNSEGNLLFTYSDNFLGKINSISIGEGLKVLVYYQENAQIAILDNTLSELTSTVNLNFNNLGTVSLATSSVRNNYWFFDPIQSAIIRTTNTITVVFNSGNLDQLLNYRIDPNYMVEYGNNLYLNDPKVGVLVFDIFGTYLKTIPIMGLEKFQVTETGFYFYSNNKLNYYDFKSFNQTEIYLPIDGVEQVLIANKMLFIQTDKSVSGWNLKSILKN